MKISKLILYILLIVATISFIYPFYWMIVASLTPESQIGDFTLLPHGITFSNYLVMFQKIPIWKSLLNSLFVAGSSTLGIITFGSMIGYSLAKLEFKGRDLLFFIIIFTMTLPFQITLIPNYILMVKFKLVDTFTTPYFLIFTLPNFHILSFPQ